MSNAWSNGGHNRSNPALSDAQVEELVARREQGERWTDIAKDFGVTPPAIMYRFKKAHEEPKPAPMPAPKEEGASDEDLAAMIMCCRHSKGVDDLRALLDALDLLPRRKVA